MKKKFITLIKRSLLIIGMTIFIYEVIMDITTKPLLGNINSIETEETEEEIEEEETEEIEETGEIEEIEILFPVKTMYREKPDLQIIYGENVSVRLWGTVIPPPRLHQGTDIYFNYLIDGKTYRSNNSTMLIAPFKMEITAMKDVIKTNGIGMIKGVGIDVGGHKKLEMKALHLSVLNPNIKVGDIVEQGTSLGVISATGTSGQHLHIEYRDGNKNILNPETLTKAYTKVKEKGNYKIVNEYIVERLYDLDLIEEKEQLAKKSNVVWKLPENTKEVVLQDRELNIQMIYIRGYNYGQNAEAGRVNYYPKEKNFKVEDEVKFYYTEGLVEGNEDYNGTTLLEILFKDKRGLILKPKGDGYKIVGNGLQTTPVGTNGPYFIDWEKGEWTN